MENITKFAMILLFLLITVYPHIIIPRLLIAIHNFHVAKERKVNFFSYIVPAILTCIIGNFFILGCVSFCFMSNLKFLFTVLSLNVFASFVIFSLFFHSINKLRKPIKQRQDNIKLEENIENQGKK